MTSAQKNRNGSQFFAQISVTVLNKEVFMFFIGLAGYLKIRNGSQFLVVANPGENL